jgi:hypothetical protein
MDVPDGIGEPALGVLAFISFEQLLILVNMTWNDIEIETLCRLRLAIHEERQRLRAGIAQPFVDGQAIAPGLGDLLALLVEKELVVEAFGRRAAKRSGFHCSFARPPVTSVVTSCPLFRSL